MCNQPVSRRLFYRKLYNETSKTFKTLEEDYKFYSYLISNNFLEEAHFFWLFLIDCYSRNPQSAWGKDRRSERRKDISCVSSTVILTKGGSE